MLKKNTKNENAVHCRDVPRKPEPIFWATEAWFNIIVFYLLLSEGLGTWETTSTNERETANLFSKYFSSVFSDNQLNLDTSSLGIKSFDLPNNVNFTVENVYKHLTDLHGLSYKVLYCALVRPIVEYGAVIWDLHDLNDSLRLERVQRKFMRYASFRLNIPCEPHNYGPVAFQLELVSLAERRRISGIKFLNSLLQGDIDSPYLLSLICFRVPQRHSRSVAPFYVPFAFTNYLKNEPFTRMISNTNVDLSFLFCKQFTV
ncbi:hypothetical protein QTP88_022290 [Uroleucon formosanum]